MLTWKIEKIIYYAAMGMIIAIPTTDKTIIAAKLATAFGLTQWVETVIDRDMTIYMKTFADNILVQNTELFQRLLGKKLD